MPYAGEGGEALSSAPKGCASELQNYVVRDQCCAHHGRL